MTIKEELKKNWQKIMFIWVYMIIFTIIDLILSFIIFSYPHTLEKNIWASWILSHFGYYGYFIALVINMIFFILILVSIVVVMDIKYKNEKAKDIAINIAFVLIILGWFIIFWVNTIKSIQILMSVI